MWQAFLTLIEPFRFLKHFRERQLERARLARDERDAERAHQRSLLQTFLSSLESIQDTSAAEASKNAEGLIAVATSMARQAEGFAKWMECFNVTSPPATSNVRDDDEVKAELERDIANGMPVELANVPEELRLAWVLRNDPNRLLD